MKHPREMTLAELEALPIVIRLFRREASFRDSAGKRWAVGAQGDLWCKSPLEEPPAQATAAKRA